MHEISLIRNIIATLEHEFSPEEVLRIEQIDLKIGLLSNVEPLLLQNALQAVQEAESKLQEVKLEIELVPATIECPNCGTHSIVHNYTFICSHCATPTNNIITGTELLISRIHFAEPVSN